jgi:hypothetical protein
MIETVFTVVLLGAGAVALNGVILVAMFKVWGEV